MSRRERYDNRRKRELRLYMKMAKILMQGERMTKTQALRKVMRIVKEFNSAVRRKGI